MTITIGLPCEVFDVRVSVAPSEHLTPIEEIALRVIGAGVDQFSELNKLLGLEFRLTLDLLQDLWRREYVRVDVVNARVVLAPHVEAIVDQPERLRTLRPARVEEQVWSLVVDRISGQVTPAEQASGPADLLPAPKAVAAWSEADLRTQDLLAAVVASHRSRYGDNPDAPRILSVDLAPKRAKRSRPQYLPVNVIASRDVYGTVHARVAPDFPLASVYRDRLDRYLADQLEAPQSSRFAGAIAGQAVDVLGEPPSLPERIERLRERIGRLDQAPAGTWGEIHTDLANQAAVIEAELSVRESARVDVELSTDAREQFQALLGAIQAARHQVVLVCPWIRWDPLNELLDALIAATRRGVRVFLAWGYNHEDELPHRVDNVLRTERERFPKRFVHSDRSARTHAKVAVCDDRWALVTSLDFLSSPRTKTEVGVVVTTSDETTWSPIEELLRWVRDQYPDASLSRGILVSWEAVRGGNASSELLEPVTYGDPPESGDMSDETLAAVRALWKREWEVVLGRLEARSRRLPVHVDRFVVDGMHRALLDDALRGAEKRILVTTDQLSPTVVTDRFLAALEERLRSGTHVRIVYGRWRDTTEAAADGVRGAFARLAAAHGEAFVVRELPGWHAKVLVCDDQVVVGSFNYLSFEGHYREGRKSRRSEVSASLAGGDVADRFADALCSLADVRKLPAVEVPGAAAEDLVVPSDDADFLRQARRLVESDPAARRAVIAELPVDTDLDRLLAVLEADGAPQELVAEVAAALLANSRTHPALAHWADRLTAHLWRDRRFVEGMLVRAEFGGAGRPTPWVSDLGAFAGSPLFDEWLGGCDLAALDPDERAALAFAVAVETLVPHTVEGQQHAPLVLGELAGDELPVATGELVRLTLEHWRRHGPLPALHVARWTATTEHLRRVEQQAGEVRAAATRWRTAAPPGQDSTRVRGYLGRATSPAGLLLGALEPGDDGLPARERLAAWRDDYGKAGADALHTRIEQDAGGFVRTTGGRRVSYVERTIVPVLAAVDVLLEELGIDVDESTALLEAVRPTLRALGSALASSEGEVAALPWDLRLVVAQQLERLRRVVQ